MSGNFKREGDVSSKLESRLRQSAENATLLHIVS
jgi:hypothetical protein